MRYEIAALIVLGALGIASAVTGIQSYSTSTSGTFVAYHSGVLSKAVAAAWGVYLLWLALAIHRKSMVGYWGGWALLVASLAWFLYGAVPVVLASEPAPPAWFQVASLAFIVLGAFFVFASWGRWWYRRRTYFQSQSG